MSGFTGIQASMFLMLLLLTAASGQVFSSVTVREGDEVTLPCENVINDQDGCRRTNWLFIFNGAVAEELVTFGRVSEHAESKSDRLSVTENCSLVMKKVTVKDLGLYTCRRINSGQHQDAHISLSVVYMTEQKINDKVKLSCSVLANGLCMYTVKWLYEGKDVVNEDMKTSHSQCSVTVTFPTVYLKHKSENPELFKCRVTNRDTKKEQKFTASLRSSGEDTITPRSVTTAASTTTSAAATSTTSTATSTTSTATPQEDCCVVNHIMLVLRVAEIVLITVITVLLIRAPGNHRPPDDVVVKYENFGDSSASVRLR